jgi:hypothetical protein
MIDATKMVLLRMKAKRRPSAIDKGTKKKFPKPMQREG